MPNRPGEEWRPHETRNHHNRKHTAGGQRHRISAEPPKGKTPVPPRNEIRISPHGLLRPPPLARG